MEKPEEKPEADKGPITSAAKLQLHASGMNQRSCLPKNGCNHRYENGNNHELNTKQASDCLNFRGDGYNNSQIKESVGEVLHANYGTPSILLTAGYEEPDKVEVEKHTINLCRVILKCGHECSGNSEECFQGRFHKRCSSKCDGRMAYCQHLCRYPCREACRPCAEPCPLKCSHSRCNKLCGEVCTPCEEPCPRSCAHILCTNSCSQPCVVPPCEKPCEQLLKCNHKCAGLCGDPCLSTCKLCSPDDFEVFFGTEDEPDARFVQLQDCDHIVENSAMIKWLNQKPGLIAFKECPFCKTPIKTTHRYSDNTKAAELDVVRIKVLLAGLPEENEADAKTLSAKVRIVKNKAQHESISEALDVLLVRLEPTRSGIRQPIDKVQLNAITSKVQLIERLMEVTGNFIGKSHEAICTEHIKAILEVVVTRDEDYITDQEIDDASREIDRLSKIISFSGIDRSKKWQITPEVEKKLKRGEVLAFAQAAYTYEDDREFAKILEELKQVFTVTLIPEVERQQILKAMSLRKGHWFKCPNGHVYAIGDCGGAIEISVCHECGERIGGSSHRVLDSNALASEMDGAIYAAYSEAANDLANFNLDDLE